ncbi:MAG: Fur family transcriptional regulator [Bacillota bacterium]
MKADCFDDALRELRERGFKLTPQRRAVLELFCSDGARHLTAQQAHDAIRGREPNVGLVTVYRCLELFTNVGILDKIKFNDGFDRYELHGGASGHHHHLVCTECGHVVEFGDCLIRSIERKLEKMSGFCIEGHWLELIGQCRECRERTEEDD